MTSDTPADGEALAEDIAELQMMDLDDGDCWTEDEVRRTQSPNDLRVIATILNAVLSGALIPRPAEPAQAAQVGRGEAVRVLTFEGIGCGPVMAVRLARALLAALDDLDAVKAERRMIVSHATMGGTDGEGMSVNAISVRITALRNELYQEAKTAALDDFEATQAADRKAHEKEIAVWSENYAALDRERDEARRIADHDKALWLAAEAANAAMTEREGVLREAMAAARLDIARERPFAASDRLTAALQHKDDTHG